MSAPANHDPALEDGIPLIDQPESRPSAQPYTSSSSSVRRRPLPFNAQLPLNIPASLKQTDSKYIQVSCDEHDDTSYAPVTKEPASVLNHAARSSTWRLPRRPWLPYTLRLPSLLALAVLNAVLLATVIILHRLSAVKTGLVTDDSSPLVFFLWRFAPTLVAVIYVFVWTMLLEDVKRTENYARLAGSDGSSAPATILHSSGPWFSTFTDSFPRRKNDYQFSWTMLCTVSAYMLGFMVLSPFSSALLVPRDVTVIEQTTFRQPLLDSTTSLQPSLEALTYFRTIGHLLQGVTTSAWISDEYSIVPFWPSSISRPAISASLSSTAQIWRMQTDVLQSELQCQKVMLSAGPVDFNYTYSRISSGSNETDDYSEMLASFQLSSSSGCQYSMAFLNSTTTNDRGWSFWSRISNTTILNLLPDSMLGDTPYSRLTGEDNRSLLLNYTKECGSGEVIVTTTGLPNNTASFKAVGQVCQPQFYIAKVMVNASTDQDSSLVAFDKKEYEQLRKPILDNMINVTHFQNEFLGIDWPDYVSSFDDTGPVLGGPATLLSALYNFNLSDMMADDSVMSRANLVKQRAFGEAVQAALLDSSRNTLNSGETINIHHRIVIVPAIAYVVEAALIIQLALLLIIVLRSRPNSRPLQLSVDPAFINTTISLIATQETTQSQLKDLHDVRSVDLKPKLLPNKYKIDQGVLHTTYVPIKMDSTTQSGPQRSVLTPIEPWILSHWLIGCLVLLLVMVLVSIAVLYHYSTLNELYQSAFVYQMNVKLGSSNLGTLAPYSIIPTLIAVTIGLWWGVIESTYRVAQPFIAMAKRPTAVVHGSGASYQSSYMLWAATKAIYRKHWLLALVCIGAFSTQALTIAMSALWQKESWYLKQSSVATQLFELRQIPHLVLTSVPLNSGLLSTYVGHVLQLTFNDLKTNWMYSAAIQLSFNGSEPPWSSNGWSFVPMDLSQSQRSLRTTAKSQSSVVKRTTNATVKTPAIRGRLECTPWASDIHPSWWLTEWDLTNETIWNTTVSPKGYERGYQLGCLLDSKSVVQIDLGANSSDIGSSCNPTGNFTYFIPGPGEAICCAQGSAENPGSASLGYWTINKGIGEPINLVWPANFTVKWITGRAISGFQDIHQQYSLIWPESPKLAALNCKPVIEQAESVVTVDIDTYRVLDYIISGNPEPVSAAWAEAFVEREHVDEDKYQSGEDYSTNVTTSYGILFESALLQAAQISRVLGCGKAECGFEKLDDRYFNIRRPGLNADYMSYSMLSLANNNSDALLNTTTLTSLAQKTFTTFFQHFVSMRVQMSGDGGWAFQRVNATLPEDLLPPIDTTLVNQRTDHQSQVSNTTSITISQPIETLVMSPLAFWLCVSILAWLLITIILVALLKKRYFSPLLRNVDTLADVAIMVAGSERFLRFAREKGTMGMQNDKTFETRLGWFRTKGGEVRWGIELVCDDVEFLSDAEVKGIFETHELQQTWIGGQEDRLLPPDSPPSRGHN